jgi:hypothetical protein
VIDPEAGESNQTTLRRAGKVRPAQNEKVFNSIFSNPPPAEASGKVDGADGTGDARINRQNCLILNGFAWPSSSRRIQFLSFRSNWKVTRFSSPRREVRRIPAPILEPGSWDQSGLVGVEPRRGTDALLSAQPVESSRARSLNHDLPSIYNRME